MLSIGLGEFILLGGCALVSFGGIVAVVLLIQRASKSNKQS